MAATSFFLRNCSSFQTFYPSSSSSSTSPQSSSSTSKTHPVTFRFKPIMVNATNSLRFHFLSPTQMLDFPRICIFSMVLIIDRLADLSFLFYFMGFFCQMAGSEIAEEKQVGGSGKKKIFVAGATGSTGKRIVEQLLAKGFSVKAGVRDIEKARLGFSSNIQDLQFVSILLYIVLYLMPLLKINLSFWFYCLSSVFFFFLTAYCLFCII